MSQNVAVLTKIVALFEKKIGALFGGFRHEKGRFLIQNYYSLCIGLIWIPWWFYQVIWSKFHGTRLDWTKAFSRTKCDRGLPNFTWIFVDRNKRNSTSKNFVKPKGETGGLKLDVIFEDFRARFWTLIKRKNCRGHPQLQNGVLISIIQ